jgi:hypothetical protein
VLGSFAIRKAGHALHSRFLTELMDGKGYANSKPLDFESGYLSAEVSALA